MERYISLKDALDDRIAMEISIVGSSSKKICFGNYCDTLNTLLADNCLIHTLKNIKIYDVPKESTFKRYDDLIDVTGDSRFSFSGILSGKAKATNVIVEGADGTGKTTATRRIALEEGLLCKDRDANNISRYVSSKEISFQEKVKRIYEFIDNNKDLDILFLVLSDTLEMQRRIFSRKRITHYDLMAIETQKTYIDIYKELCFLPNLYLYDVSYSSKEEVKNLVRSHIRVLKEGH